MSLASDSIVSPYRGVLISDCVQFDDLPYMAGLADVNTLYFLIATTLYLHIHLLDAELGLQAVMFLYLLVFNSSSSVVSPSIVCFL